MLAVRGDESGYQKPLRDGKTANEFAVDLVRQVGDMNRGRYLATDLLDAEPSDFCVGVSGYPEKHFEAPNLETDVRRTKEKIDAGGGYIVTQMFFDNRRYFDYVDKCRAAGIAAPIIPGLKILTGKAQLASIPRNFYVDIPADLSDEASAVPDEQVLEVGVEWALAQAEELLSRGVPSLHFYVMSSSTAIKKLMTRLKVAVG